MEYQNRYICEDDKCFRIVICGKEILNVDLESGWHIAEVAYPEGMTAGNLRRLTVELVKGPRFSAVDNK